MKDLPLEMRLIENGREKAEAVMAMGPGEVIAIGNGRNDIPMMEVAGLSIAVVGPEGAAAGLLGPADIVTRDILDALDLITNPLRLKATLRD
jgi:soluble P-type ATPase